MMQEEYKNSIEQGKFLFNTRQYKAAEEVFTKIIESKKAFADVYNLMGIIAHQDGRFGEAIQFFEQALKINSRYTEALLNLSILYNDLSDYEKARKLVERSRKESQKTKTAMDPFIRSKLANKHAEVGDVYRGVGAFKQAIQEYKKALELEDKYVDIRTKMAICLREEGDKQKAATELKQALKDNPDYPDAQIQLGVTYYSLGKKTDARKIWKQASKKFPTNQTVKMYLSFTE
jgi:tetratricopeptide (TPR) repeat protein